MFKKPVCRLRLGSRLARLRDLRLRPRIKIPGNFQEPPIQAPVSQIDASKFGFRPILSALFGGRHHRRHHPVTETFSRPPIERIYEYPFDGGSAAVAAVLPSSSLRFAHLYPIRGPVA